METDWWLLLTYFMEIESEPRDLASGGGVGGGRRRAKKAVVGTDIWTGKKGRIGCPKKTAQK